MKKWNGFSPTNKVQKENPKQKLNPYKDLKRASHSFLSRWRRLRREGIKSISFSVSPRVEWTMGGVRNSSTEIDQWKSFPQSCKWSASDKELAKHRTLVWGDRQNWGCIPWNQSWVRALSQAIFQRRPWIVEGTKGVPNVGTLERWEGRRR